MKMPFLFLIITLLSQVLIAKPVTRWEFKEKCSSPESVYYDKVSKKVFVSNIVGEGTGKDSLGHISLLSSNGEVIEAEWIKGLNAPKGMRAHDGHLWVTDIDRVIVINIKLKKIVNRIEISGAKFLNDIAISSNGDVYVSDTLTSRIHLIRNSKSSVFLSGKGLESPNGLLVLDGKLFVAAWGFTTDWTTKNPGRLYSVDLGSKKISYITKKPLGNLDGLELSRDGSFLISDWVSGKIFKVTRKGGVEIHYVGKKGLADIGYILDQDVVLVPYMLDHTVIAF